MVLKRRTDGAPVRDLPALRRIVPYLMPTRAEAVVYFQQRLEVDGLLRWLDDANHDRPEAERITIFHVFLAAVARTFRLRPEVNRFVVGRRTYEHDDISISFIVKQELTDTAPETEVRLVFTGEESVEDVRRMVVGAVRPGRGPHRGDDDRLVDFFASWPRPVLNAIAGTIRRLDYHNALPDRLRAAIPLYTSVYVVNTGSIGIAPPFHHLYEHGTASAFVAIGRATQQPVVDAEGAVVARWVVDLVHTLDERATDGFYFAKTAEVFRRLVEEPHLLDRTDVTVDDLVPVWPPRH